MKPLSWASIREQVVAGAILLVLGAGLTWLLSFWRPFRSFLYLLWLTAIAPAPIPTILVVAIVLLGGLRLLSTIRSGRLARTGRVPQDLTYEPTGLELDILKLAASNGVGRITAEALPSLLQTNPLRLQEAILALEAEGFIHLHKGSWARMQPSQVALSDAGRRWALSRGYAP